MGCCFSINSSDSKEHQNFKNTHQPHLRSPTPKSNETLELNHRAPRPPPVEEETVKEVLSETPISKPQVSIFTAETKTQLPEKQYPKCPIFEKAEEPVSEEVSQITETCSIRESFSTTTTTTTATTAATTVTTLTEMIEDEATSKRSTREGTQKNRYRSQSNHSYGVDGNRTGARERKVKSPARTLDNRIPASSQPVRRREPGGVRRDPGESTGRGSRSPSATGRAGSVNARNQVKPPGTPGRMLPPVKGLEKENEERIWEENNVVRHEESFENPHVSMECFIFL